MQQLQPSQSDCVLAPYLSERAEDLSVGVMAMAFMKTLIAFSCRTAVILGSVPMLMCIRVPYILCSALMLHLQLRAVASFLQIACFEF